MLKTIDIVVLCGGLGTRISAVLGDTPKILAPVDGHPFLAILAGWLKGFGARRLVLCIGHLAHKVTAYLAATPLTDMAVATSIEAQPLGTGGALRQAMPLLTSDPVMVMNGDSWISADLGAFAADFHASGAEIAMLCVAVDDARRFGRVEMDAGGRVSAFAEKDAAHTGPGLINAGIYLFSQAALADLAATAAVSLEREFLATRPAGAIRAFVPDGARFIDIGTPESLAQAVEIIDRAKAS
ncbi:Nucleoside-diphosphate-sugar pyrophosphorylase [Candidatus Terasakiella magnetica]|nr:Nucleoside-diphosphate-sugar pyrophosphorylase [Candidatus Terasakiella magnetica]